MDLAASIQAVTEEVMLRLTRSSARPRPGAKNLCLAGGVALNCVANGKILRDGPFENIWIQPAAGDAGGALGAALAAYYHVSRTTRDQVAEAGDAMKGAYLGPSFRTARNRGAPAGGRRPLRTCSSDDAADRACAPMLWPPARRVGWFQGRMEFGPRALGAARFWATRVAQHAVGAEPEGQVPRVVPAVRAVGAARGRRRMVRAGLRQPVHAAGGADVVEKRRRHDDAGAEQALFGIEKLNVPRSEIPAVTHVDYSARIQTVHRETNPRYHALLSTRSRRRPAAR